MMKADGEGPTESMDDEGPTESADDEGPTEKRTARVQRREAWTWKTGRASTNAKLDPWTSADAAKEVQQTLAEDLDPWPA